MKPTICEPAEAHGYGYGWEDFWDNLPQVVHHSNQPMKITPTTREEWAEIFNAGYL